MEAFPSNPAWIGRLQRHLWRHNAQVLLLTLLTLVAAMALWGIAYLAAAWMTLLGATIIVGTRGLEPEMPRRFPAYFLVAAGALLAVAIWRRSRTRDERPRDGKAPLEYALEFLLLLPGMTVAVWSNLSAWCWLSRRDLRLAASLLERVGEDERFPLCHLPVELPDEALRDHIVLVLLLTGVLDLRREEGATYLRLARAFRPTLSVPEERLLAG